MSSILALGVESSCDETSIGIVSPEGEILVNHTYSQIQDHAPFGGVVPEIAARAHIAVISPLVKQALRKSGVALSDIKIIVAALGSGFFGGF